MSEQRALKKVSSQERYRQLEAEFAAARESLREAEARLAAEQAEINAFRMHCRLKLGPWVETLQELKTEKQRLLIRLRMWEQAAESGQPFEEDEWLKQSYTRDQADNRDETETADPPQDDPEDDPQAGRPIVDLKPGDRKAEKRLYRELARRFHPDLIEDALMRSYATSMMAAVNDAYSRGDTQALRDLAGELDPAAAAQLDQESNHSPQFKTLQKRLRKCRQRERKIQAQYDTLRQELVALLWRKAQQADPDEGENWWDEVAALFTADIERLQQEIADLQTRLLHLQTA